MPPSYVKNENFYERNTPKLSERIENQKNEIYDLRDKAERLYLEIESLKESAETQSTQLTALTQKNADYKKQAKSSAKEITTLTEKIAGFQEKGLNTAAKTMRNALNALVESMPEGHPDKLQFEAEMEGFFHLFTRYFTEKASGAKM